MLNDGNAKLLKREDIFPDGANTPTRRSEYACPCGKGKIIYEKVSGFGDYNAYIECETCEALYDVITGCGHIWELRNK